MRRSMGVPDDILQDWRYQGSRDAVRLGSQARPNEVRCQILQRDSLLGGGCVKCLQHSVGHRT